MLFWSSATNVAAKLESMRSVEAKILEFVKRFSRRTTDDYSLNVIDTQIPRAVVPLQSHSYDIYNDSDDEYKIHCIHVSSKASAEKSETPLVLLHGYMNGAAYFYRNLAGLSSCFSSIYALDQLGWGLSSRPNFHLKDNSTETAEDFFVASLEAWRQKNQIDKMVLAGHSIGGYLSVAYCERYPEHVERLILISPVGVPYESRDVIERREARIQSSLRSRVLFHLYNNLFYSHTVGSVLRFLPINTSRGYILQYVERRLPAISEKQEQEVLADYLFHNTHLPGSGEYCVSRILTPHAFALKPLVDRIPQLKVSHVSFLYGANDWMDPTGGLQVQQRTECLGPSAPTVDVCSVSNAGHLLMLENWEEFNTGLIMSAGKVPETTAPRPTKLDPNTVAPAEKTTEELRDYSGVEVNAS